MKVFQKYNKIIAFLLVGLIITFNSSATYVHASGVVSGVTTALQASGNALVKCFLVANGVISREFGGLAPVSTSLQSALLDEVQNQMDLGGIYEQDGKIYFTSSAMEDLYAILGFSGNARIVSDFSSFNLYAPDQFSGYVNTQFLDDVNTIVNDCKNSGHHYLFFNYLSDSIVNADNKHIVYLSFQAVQLPTDFGYTCWSTANGGITRWKLFRSNGNVYKTSNSDCPTVRSCYVNWKDGVVTSNSLSTWHTSYDLPQTDVSIAQNLYDFFPSYADNFTSGSNQYTQYSNYFCDVPFIIAEDGTSANSILTKSFGNYYFNNYTSYNIDSNTFYNNDWTKIYKSYTNSVVNQYNTYIDNGDTVTTQVIYDIMNTFIQPVYIGIEDGDTEIAGKIDYINEWLSKIYENTNIMISGIDDLITAVSSGGSACLWSQSEIDSVCNNLSAIYGQQVSTDADILLALQYLKDKLLAIQTTTDTVNSVLTNINTNSSIIVDNLDMQLSRLATIINKLDNIYNKMGSGSTIVLPSIDPSITADLDDILDSDLFDNVFHPFEIAAQIISAVVPVCYIFVAVGILNYLSAPKMTPKWEIPIKSERFNIDTKFVIDFTNYETLATFLRAFILLSVGFGLAVGSVNIVKRILQIVSL